MNELALLKELGWPKQLLRLLKSWKQDSNDQIFQAQINRLDFDSTSISGFSKAV